MEGNQSRGMWFHMDANVMRSQLRYRPKENIQLLYYTRFLKNVKPNFEDISGERADLEK